MEFSIFNLEIHIPCFFITEDTCFSNILESAAPRIFNIIKVLDTFSMINYNVRTNSSRLTIWTHTPYLLSDIFIPSVLLYQGSCFFFFIKSMDLPVFDSQSQHIIQRRNFTPESVLFIWGLRKTGLARILSNTFRVTNNRLTNVNLKIFGIEFP